MFLANQMKDRFMKYRGWEEIIASILESATNGATCSSIMNKTFLSFSQTNYYLLYLIKNNLINYDRKSSLYIITEEGVEFLHNYSKIFEPLPSNEAKKEAEMI